MNVYVFCIFSSDLSLLMTTGLIMDSPLCPWGLGRSSLTLLGDSGLERLAWVIKVLCEHSRARLCTPGVWPWRASECRSWVSGLWWVRWGVRPGLGRRQRRRTVRSWPGARGGGGESWPYPLQLHRGQTSSLASNCITFFWNKQSLDRDKWNQGTIYLLLGKHFSHV